ncbi:hypothetical protein [Desulfosarcina ovata]|uniref:hypothetical protein n=1 Tax=Desulfosarcina ovata TaxID=83564 RepID=UPI0012D308F1|nr:hypothetical protein [Desulfosarcina ovata]
MKPTTFKALVITEIEGKQYLWQIQDKSVDDLPAGDVPVRVHFSSLNYKDGNHGRGDPPGRSGSADRLDVEPTAQGTLYRQSDGLSAIGTEEICTVYRRTALRTRARKVRGCRPSMPSVSSHWIECPSDTSFTA